MPRKVAFEELVLAQRAKDRETIAAGMAADKGPMMGGRARSEEEQDELWAHMAPEYADPQAFLMLTLPKEQGGQGLTPLAASYQRYPNRQILIEGAGADIESQIRYAEKRKERMLNRKNAAIAEAEPLGMEVSTDG